MGGEWLSSIRPLGGVTSILTSFVVNFATQVWLGSHLECGPGLGPQGAVMWLPNGAVRVRGAAEVMPTFPLKFYFSPCVGRITTTGRNHSRFSVTGLRGRWDAAVCRRMTVLWREGACGSGASEELLFFTCALIDPANTDGWSAGSLGRGPRATRRPLPESGGRGERPRCIRHTPHLTRGHGRRGEGRRVQTEDAHLQKR